MADEELRASYRRVTLAAFRLHAARTGGSVTEEDGLLFASAGHPGALLVHAAFRARAGLPPAEALRRARDHYASLGREFEFTVSLENDLDIDRAAAATGWRHIIDLPGMVIEAPLDAGTPGDGVRLRHADPADGEAFGRIAAACFADDEWEAEGYRAVFAHPEMLEGPAAGAFIASVDGEDAAAAWAMVDGAAGWIGWVGTLREFRRRGLGALVTRAATNEAFRRGARVVALQASPSGFPVYRAMGFRTIANERVWEPPRRDS